MLIKSHRQLITHSALFQNLTTDECQALLDTGRCHQVLAQTFPFHAGELAHTFYILISGSVRLVQATASGKQVILHYISPGRYFGVSVALSGMHYGVSAETIENSILYCWNADSVRQLMAQYPRLALNA
ncbi:MAG TPA: cyclic nucleotide-binding domain-containing protein, partial [Anaerolineae bacterium]|nr:cyclic nucleotide-binding domain-containing protein [Anaerolineae bacterium]